MSSESADPVLRFPASAAIPSILAESNGYEHKINKLKSEVESLKKENKRLNASIRDIKIMHEHHYDNDMMEWKVALEECQVKLKQSKQNENKWMNEALEMKEIETIHRKQIKSLNDSVTNLKSQIVDLKSKMVQISSLLHPQQKRKLFKDNIQTPKRSKQSKLANDEWKCTVCSLINHYSKSGDNTNPKCELCGNSKQRPVIIIQDDAVSRQR